MKTPNLYPGIKKEIQKLQKIAEDAMPLLGDRVCYIIENKIEDEYSIEKTLDDLMNMMYLGIGEKEFHRLNDYYSKINKESSDFYEKLEKESFSQD
jgi:hypothetical protein